MVRTKIFLIMLLTYIISYLITALMVWFFNDNITYIQAIKSGTTFFFSVFLGWIPMILVYFDLEDRF